VIVVVAAIPMVLLSKLFGGGVGDWHQLLRIEHYYEGIKPRQVSYYYTRPLYKNVEYLLY
jgi:hypothetical protein